MKHIFPEINFDRLKAEVFRWSSWYPCIRQIDFYQHRGGENYADKRYLIDIVVQDDTPQNEIADIEIETQDIGGSTFFQSLMNAQTGKGFKRDNWELFVRQQSDDPPVFLAGDKWSLYDRYLPKMKFYPFQELNIHVLQAIAAKWAQDYTSTGAVVQSITIHPMGMPIHLAENLPDRPNRPKYAVIFHCPDCTRDDLPSATDSAEEHLRKVINKEFSPYTDLFLDLQNKSKHLFYNGNFKLYQGAEPNDWLSEWRFEMKYQDKGMSALGADIDQKCGVVLFPAVEVEQAADLAPYKAPEGNVYSYENKIQDPEDIKTTWRFHFTGAEWRIFFKGHHYSVKDFKPVRYILPLIKQPGKRFGYVKICQIVEGVNIKDAPKKDKKKKEAGDLRQDGSVYEDDLNDQISAKKHTEKDIQKLKESVCKLYQEYLNDRDGKREGWNKVKQFTETEYGILINDKGGRLKFRNSKFPAEADKDYKKAQKAVSTNKGRFLENLKKTGCDKLHEHFVQSIISKEGFIQYSPSPESSLWEIIE